MRFLSGQEGQVEAIDTLIFAMLVSISAVLLATYGVGSYHQDLHMQALQHRYTADFAQSFVMTSRYVSSGEEGIVYTIGPNISDDSVFYTLFGIINGSLGKSPLERKVKGNFLEIIAEDLYLSLAFRSENQSYPLNNWFLTGGFHDGVEDFVIGNLDFLSGSMFYYRIEASYHPYEGTDIENILYSEAVYTNSKGVPDAGVYVTEIVVAIPSASQENAGLITLPDFSKEMGSGVIGGIFPGQLNSSGYTVQEAIGDLDGILDEISRESSEFKKTGRVIIKIWPRVGGENAGIF